MKRLTHLDDDGKAKMVDVGDKAISRRVARAEARVRLGDQAFLAVQQQSLAKGDALGVARIAAIQCAKRTSEWIPLCHTLPLDAVEVDFQFLPEAKTLRIEATVSTSAKTGVEMEALVAVQAAALTIYDMAKAIEKGIVIDGVRLLEKRGGKSGEWTAAPSAES